MGFRRARSGVLTKLELVVTLILIMVFIRVVMQQLWALRVVAERTHVTWTVGAMQSAIGIEIARRALQGGMTTIAELEGSNPYQLLLGADGRTSYQSQPNSLVAHLLYQGNYLGELVDPDLESMQGGSWYFDPAQRTLVYRVSQQEAFVTPLEGPARIRFYLRAGGEGSTGVGLNSLEPYQWYLPEEPKRMKP